jgi:hypothetical protein
LLDGHTGGSFAGRPGSVNEPISEPVLGAGHRAPVVEESAGVTETAERVFAWVVHFLKRGGLWWGIGVSVGLAVLSLALATAVVVGWPPDRFKGEGPTNAGQGEHVVVRAVAFLGRNLAGAVLVVLGAVMAIPGVPGQGLLTMLIGLTLLSFPGKRRLERRLVQMPPVLRAINRLRARFARPPLELD